MPLETVQTMFSSPSSELSSVNAGMDWVNNNFPKLELMVPAFRAYCYTHSEAGRSAGYACQCKQSLHSCRTVIDIAKGLE